MTARLPAFLRHKDSENLVRLGRPHDGGYVVCKKDVEASDYLIGLGISDDWSFEREFLEINPVPLDAYDGSISAPVFIKHYLKNPHRLRKLKTVFDYLSFFSGQKRHIKKFVGPSSGKKLISLKTVFENTSALQMFIKMDIEGSEYRILDDIVQWQDHLSGAVIEFHDCDFHLERIERFVRAFQLKIVHIHANDFAPVSADGIPHLLEITFSRHADFSDTWRTYPQEIDRPNKMGGKPIQLTFNA